MKKILIISHCLEIGGAERALLGLLNSISYKENRVDLFLLRHEGEFMNLLPKEVNLLPQKREYSSLAVPIIRTLKKGLLAIAIGRYIGKKKAIQYKKNNQITTQKEDDIALEYSHKYTKRFMPKISNEKYDLAISFLTPHYFVAEKVEAKKKIAWIHTDYSSLEIDVESQKKMWSVYDNVISISDMVTEGFLGKFPSIKNKIVLIENILSSNIVQSQAILNNVDPEMPKFQNVVNILSIGRFTTAKNFDNIPLICKIIINQGFNIKWYIIGFGPDEKKIRAKIHELGMENNVIILGKKVNPYPYIKACDIYIQPSRYEGKAVTVREAQMLNKPVLITNFPTSKSQLRDGFDGIIVPLENNECAKGIIRLINDPFKQEMFINNCSNTNYDNEREVEKLYKLMEDVYG
ncbi:glycosyltransferase [Paenisporosarcina antarctica]|uniref:Glycosyltransferase n=1 Tax=Paenisporosarcina antarctica TaxID=417367 RepID=A0A4P6ZZ41_9BACL|nr:glycosyltransferase [Paenisporosarcina antarctica]QBP42010.1 glycosyltransferase [Paenisporosarcina antarctica]